MKCKAKCQAVQKLCIFWWLRTMHNSIRRLIKLRVHFHSQFQLVLFKCWAVLRLKISLSSFKLLNCSFNPLSHLNLMDYIKNRQVINIHYLFIYFLDVTHCKPRRSAKCNLITFHWLLKHIFHMTTKKFCLSFVFVFQLMISSQKINSVASIFKESIRLQIVLYLLQENKHVVYI